MNQKAVGLLTDIDVSQRHTKEISNAAQDDLGTRHQRYARSRRTRTRFCFRPGARWLAWRLAWRLGHRPFVRVYAGPGYYGGCMVRRWVYTPYGPVLRWVNRCY